MTEPTERPYDADLGDPLTALRIPVVTTPSPAKAYLAAIMARDEFGAWPSVRPSDAEALMISSYIAFLCSDYRPGYRAQMLARPFDLDGARATRIFRKRPDGGWCYRLDTWTGGSFWAPHEHGPAAQTLTCEQALDRLVRYGAEKIPQSWLGWKAAHPEAFPAMAAEGTADHG